MLLTWLLLCAQGATAQQNPERADTRAHFNAGKAMYEAGDFEGAIREFQKGYRLEPWPVFLFSMAQAERQNDDCPSAITHYEAFLATSPSPAQADFARQGLNQCKLTLPKSPAVQENPTTPPPALKVTPVAEPPPQHPRDEHWIRDPWGGAFAATSVVAFGVGGYFVGHAASESDGADHASSLMAYDDHVSSWHDARTIGVVSLATGGVLFAAAIVRYVLVAHRGHP